MNPRCCTPFRRTFSWHWLSWAQIFEFFSSHAACNPVSQFLAAEFLEYLRIMEVRLMAMGSEKNLTTFAGIPFKESDHPFYEPEARVILRSLMQNVRPRLEKSTILPIAQYRSKKNMTGTWEVVGFNFAPVAEAFTSHPHLTVWIHSDFAAVQLTLPKAAQARYWRALRDATVDDLRSVLLSVTDRLKPSRRRIGILDEPRLVFSFLQRRYHSRRDSVRDAELEFDVDTLASKRPRPPSSVLYVPAWIEAARTLLQDSRRANIQVALQAQFPIIDGSSTRTPGFSNQLVTAAEALEPFLTLIRR